MPKRLQLYRTDAIEVTFDPNRCIHAAICVRSIPAVFDARARPWIRPEAAPPDDVARVVARCPTGALHYRRLDGGASEQPDERPSVRATRDGPLYVRGDVTLAREDGTVILRDTRVALCRCGKSANQPYCDGTHRAIGFRDPAGPGAPPAEPEDPRAEGPREAGPPPPGVVAP